MIDVRKRNARQNIISLGNSWTLTFKVIEISSFGKWPRLFSFPNKFSDVICVLALKTILLTHRAEPFYLFILSPFISLVKENPHGRECIHYERMTQRCYESFPYNLHTNCMEIQCLILSSVKYSGNENCRKIL